MIRRAYVNIAPQAEIAFIETGIRAGLFRVTYKHYGGCVHKRRQKTARAF
jgi:hypothetical protein